jgi:AP-2 complex subunit alpha
MTDSSNAQETVAELCANLDQVDSLIKEDMVVKIALISETHASKNSSMLRWYIDTIIAIILAAGFSPMISINLIN